MRFKLIALVFVASCLPAMAAPLAPQGNFTVVEGRKVAIQGVVVLDGQAMIVLSDPDQLSLG